MVLVVDLGCRLEVVEKEGEDPNRKVPAREFNLEVGVRQP
jgi:hypothetical protein